MLYSRSTLAAALAAVPVTLAQTYTDCNPTEKTCANDVGFEGTSFSSDFTTGASANGSWSAAAYSTISYGDEGAEFTIAKQGQAPTLETDFYIFFGKVEVVMQAAPGQGIVSSIVLESDDLDEIDWEFVGGDTTQVQTNYYGKGNTTTYDRAIYYPVSSPQTTFHTYTIDWTSESIKFSVDGAVLRTLNYEDANGGSNYPQTPMKLKLGNWAGGDSGNAAGTIEWAGGLTDYTKCPFTMYVKSVEVTNYNPASEYEWTDLTGSYQSIKLIKGDGTSASAGSSSGKSSTSLTNTRAPTQYHTVKKVAVSEAVMSSTSVGAASSTTISTMVSASSSAASSKVRSGNTAQLTTLHSSVNASSTKLTSASSSAKVNATSTSSGSSATKLAMSSNTTTSLPAQQTTNAAHSNGVATVLVALGSVAFAFMIL